MHAFDRESGKCGNEVFGFKWLETQFCVTDAEDASAGGANEKLTTIAGGDSGGPVFAFDRDGKSIVLGITAYSNADSTFGFGGFTNLAEQSNFMRHAANNPVHPLVRAINFKENTDRPSDLARRPEFYSAAFDFMQKVISSFSAPNEKVAARTSELYQAQATFHGNSRDLVFIVQDRVKSAKRWPTRDYKLQDFLPISCSENECTAIADLNWSVADGRKTKSGRQRYIWTFAYSNGHFKISHEESVKIPQL